MDLQVVAEEGHHDEPLHDGDGDGDVPRGHLYAHVDDPEALVVGVVGDGPAELLLCVQQPVGPSGPARGGGGGST